VFKFNKKNLLRLAIFIVLLLIFASLIPPLRTPLLSSLKLPLSILTAIRQEFNAVIFFHRNFVQNERLKKEVDFLNNKLITRQEVYQENVRLKDLISFKEQSSFKVVASRVIGRSVDSWSSSVIIDKGKSSGIRRQMVAITYLGLIGRVIEVKESTSKILLINDPNVSVSGIVQRSRQEGLVSGTLGANLIMRYLPEESDINIGDAIITSGLNEIYPKGLVIGKVVGIGKEFSGLSRYAIIKPAVNPFNIEEVLIIF